MGDSVEREAGGGGVMAFTDESSGPKCGNDARQSGTLDRRATGDRVPSPPRRTLAGYVAISALLLLASIFSLIHRFAMWLDMLLFRERLKAQVIKRPLFIAGLPRSGTTLCHRLIAAQSQQFTAMPLWELLFAPALCQKHLFHWLYRLDQRLGKRMGLAPLSCVVEKLLVRASGSSKHIHPTSLFSAEEDALGLIPVDGCIMRIIAWPFSAKTFQLARFSSAIPEASRRKYLKHYEALLKRHLAFRGTDKTIVSKNPGFATWLLPLADFFPDARFIALTRHPVDAVPSQLSSVGHELALFGYSNRHPAVVRLFVDLLASYWESLHTSSQKLGERCCMIDYSELSGSSFELMPRMLDKLGYSITASDWERLLSCRTAVQRYRSSHQYSLTEFALDPVEIRQKFDRAAMECDAQPAAATGNVASLGDIPETDRSIVSETQSMGGR